MVIMSKSLKKALGNLDAESAASLVSAACDVALVIGSDGIIQDVSISNDDLTLEGAASWRGLHWSDTVTIESRPKVEELLRDAGSKAPPRGRQVNHPSSRGADIPVRYSALQVGQRGRVLAIGSDLRAMATLQRKLVETQQSMEREYARLRHAETRYRLLFKLAAEAVVVVDVSTLKVVEANPAAGALFGKDTRKLLGRGFIGLFDVSSAVALQGMVEAVAGSGEAAGCKAKLASAGTEFVVSASLFRQESASHLLVRVSSGNQMGTSQNGIPAGQYLSRLIERLPDGFVVTNLDQSILTANTAFLDLAQLAREEQAKGQPISRWLGRSGVDIDVLVANLRQHGSVRQFSTVVRGELGSTELVDISAVSVPSGEQPCFGMTVRRAPQPTASAAGVDPQLPRSVKQLTELVGTVPLKNLVRETTDLIERLCIEAALELTRDNRVSAAEMLGVSRQSLYSKLRRHGIGDLSPIDE